MKNNFDKFHEEEKIILHSSVPIGLNILRNTLLKNGFREMDDFFFIERKNVNCNWQSKSLIHLIALNFENNKHLDLIENDSWKVLELDYLFATLPFECVNQFLDIVFKLADFFHLTVKHRNNICDRSSLEMIFYEYQEDVRQELEGDPGSKIVRINILKTYPRTK